MRPGVVPNEQCFSTVWGGSFWHHDISKPDVRNSFKRRIDRLFGKDCSDLIANQVLVGQTKKNSSYRRAILWRTF